MKINKIKLGNIRSYLNREINFPNGSILLAGDVGSGKSTVLLALDFALFGLRIGSLVGGSLLRNGTDHGFVEVEFEIENKKVIIKRALRRNGDSIVQEPGYLVINDFKEYLSPIELKDRILGLLNYPKEFLTKNKSLIYRYTVYTPQEEMKYILVTNRESRLEILRKVFGVDKYKRIKDNSKIFVQYLKGKRKELAGKIADLDEKIDLRRGKEEKSKLLMKEIGKLENEINEIVILIKKEDEKIKNINEKVKELNEAKKQKDILELDLKHKLRKLDENALQIQGISKEIVDLDKELKQEIKADINLIKEKLRFIDELNKQIIEKNSKLGALNNRIVNSEEIKNNISKLDFCPLCKQKVTKEHIKEVINSENDKISKANKERYILIKEIDNFEKRVNIYNSEVNELRKQESLLMSLKIKKGYLEEKKKLLNKIREENNIIDADIKNLKNYSKIVIDKIGNLKDVEINLDNLNKIKEKYLEKQRNVELSKNTLETELRALQNQINEINIEIENKTKDKEELLKWTNIQNWIEDHFVKMMDLIERMILLKVHHDFNSLFQKWFSMLIEEDNIKVSMDDEFTPLIEQNGHMIDYFYLSGGEKTAAALAYRLALNQVINLLISIIKTKDLLILDEPTDGFSEVQVDRIRNVLNELNMKQIILVSHESKVENFVDNVIRLRKINHISEIY